jgi:OOP family OmpA-OmpF porin
LKGTQYEVITVNGYSDRIGSHEYNMRLSTRRAEAVRAYLVDTAGLPAGKVVARGLDGSDPVTKPNECVGEKRTPKLIVCLQPDRRVDVEVAATQLQTATVQK